MLPKHFLWPTLFVFFLDQRLLCVYCGIGHEWTGRCAWDHQGLPTACLSHPARPDFMCVWQDQAVVRETEEVWPSGVLVLHQWEPQYSSGWHAFLPIMSWVQLCIATKLKKKKRPKAWTDSLTFTTSGDLKRVKGKKEITFLARGLLH